MPMLPTSTCVRTRRKAGRSKDRGLVLLVKELPLLAMGGSL